MSLKAKCRNCGCDVPADSLKLHYELRQMVCEKCFKNPKKDDPSPIVKNEPLKPAGWDAEDDYLEKASRMKREQNQVQFSRIPGTNNVKCTCFNCKYEFRYDPFRKQPRSCPYCDSDIPKLRTFNLL
jgi:hypothetical protein